MLTCPVCTSRYPDDRTHCELDGATLVPRHSLDISFGASVADTGATSAERPSSRQQHEPATIDEGGTRVSATGDDIGTPPVMPSTGSAKPKLSRFEQTKTLAEQRVGEVLGSYRLQSVIGFGGMGAVYSAEHIKLGRVVALKLLHPQYAERRDAVIRFFQEAQAVNRIRHKNIVDVTDLVELDNGTAFIIMELLSGESLGNRMRRVGLPGTGPTISIMLQICDALSAAHSVHIVHRDLKPDNVFLTTTDDGQLLVKLLDFGVAKLVGPTGEVGGLTAAGSVVGTPAFMSPEQAGGLQIDHRSDLYSLGAIMYQLFTGQHVFRGKSFGDFVTKHLTEAPVPPRQTPGGVNMDPELEAIIMRCLSKSPDARFQSAAELRVALLGYFELFAARVGTEVESDAGVYRLSGEHRDPATAAVASAQILGTETLEERDVFGAPPATIGYAPPGGGPLRTAPHGASVETEMMVGNLPGTSPPGRPLIWAIGAFVTLTLIVVVIMATRSGDGADRVGATASDASSATQVETDAPSSRRFRIESSVVAQVFEPDASSARCGTPCQLEIDLDDGGDPQQRQLIVRAPGHHEQVLLISLASEQSLYRVELEPVAVDAAPIMSTPDASAITVGKTGGGKTGGGKTGGGKTGGGKTGGGKTGGGKTGGSGSGTGALAPDTTLDPFNKKRDR